MLKDFHTFCITHELRQISIYIQYCTQEYEEKYTFVCDLSPVTIQLFVVTAIPWYVQAC